MVGDRGWHEFYAVFNQLPPSSRVKSAISQDPEIARSQVSSLSDDEIREIMEESKSEDRRLTSEGYTLEVEKLNQVIDEIKLLRMSMDMSGKKKKFEPVKRPETELEVLLRQRIDEITEEDQRDFEKMIGF